MRSLIEKAHLVRLFVLVAALALVVAACETGAPGETEAPDSPDVPVTAGESPADDGDGDGGELDTYTLGIFQDVTTDNVWNAYDTAGNTVWNSYFLTPTTCTLYTIAMPGIELQPALAEGDLQPAEQDGDVWVAEVTMRDGLLWSDGEPITAEDVAFTWRTAIDAGLLGGWQTYTSTSLITAVEAVDDTTVRVTFNAQPGLANWGPGSDGPHFMPIQPQHFWQPVVDEALAADDPYNTLLAASGDGAPSCGATVFDARQEGSFASSTANENYPDAGREITSGGVTWTEGPYADSFQYPLYGGQEPAVLALGEGEVDLLLNPLGMQRGFQDQVAENPELTAIVNPTNGYRYLAFNHARAPMSDPAFRNALTALIDKEFVTGQLLQGVAFPLYVILPEGNERWYNAEVADQLAEEFGYRGLADQNARRAEAIRILTEAEYTWETAPGFDDPATEDVEEREPTAGEGFIFKAGEGLIGPDGEPIPQLELVTPTASYDPLRATFGNYISGVALEMGIPVVSVPTDFNKIVADVFAVADDPNPDDDVPPAYSSPYDMYILGYSLGNPAFPTFHCAFFCTGSDGTDPGAGGTDNNTQYSSPDYDAAAAAFNAAQTEDEAFEAMWEMERLIAQDKPHVPLFDTGILEFYNNRVEYPFTETLSGLQFISGMPSAVTAK